MNGAESGELGFRLLQPSVADDEWNKQAGGQRMSKRIGG